MINTGLIAQKSGGSASLPNGLLKTPLSLTTSLQTISDNTNIASPISLSTTTVKTDGFLVQAAPTLTGSMTTSALSISQTINTTGSPDVINLDVTHTNSTATNLLNLKVGGVSAFSVNRFGATKIGLTSGNNWLFSSNQLISSQNAFIAANGNVVLGTGAFVGGIQANNTGGKKPLVVETISNTAEVVIAVVTPTSQTLPPVLLA